MGHGHAVSAGGAGGLATQSPPSKPHSTTLHPKLPSQSPSPNHTAGHPHALGGGAGGAGGNGAQSPPSCWHWGTLQSMARYESHTPSPIHEAGHGQATPPGKAGGGGGVLKTTPPLNASPTGGGGGGDERKIGGVGGEGGASQYMYQTFATCPSGSMHPRPWSVWHHVPPRSLSGLAQPALNVPAYAQHAMQVQGWEELGAGGGGGDGFGGGGVPVTVQ